jgi:hypothetical protein
MLDANEARVLERIAPGDRVLDVGGWARCFNRATHVIDFHPYEGHGRHYFEQYGLAAQGGPVEHFTADTWVARDICDRTPWPYPDKFFDFSICSHTLEDLRDPIWVCHELTRVSRRGYVEVPSMVFELTRGREPDVPTGLSHHRWICSFEAPHGLVFSPKNHYVHGNPRYNLPPSFGGLPPESQVIWLFWDESFSFREGWLSREDLAAFVRMQVPEGNTEPNPSELDRELDQVRFLLADAERRLRIEHETTQELRAELAVYAGLGPRSIRMARGIQHWSRRYPRAAAFLRRLVPAA